LSADELDTLLEIIDAQELDGVIDRYAAAAIRLLVFTGCRMGEVLTLEWASVDLETARLTLERHKSDQNGAKVIPLTAPALDVLRTLVREEKDPYVIVGRHPGTCLINLQKPWRRVRQAAGLNDVRLHDLRHSFASFAVGAGVSLPVIGGLLGHRSVQTTARYAHLAQDPLKQATDVVGAILATAPKALKSTEDASQGQRPTP
jgi:integrase